MKLGNGRRLTNPHNSTTEIEISCDEPDNFMITCLDLKNTNDWKTFEDGDLLKEANIPHNLAMNTHAFPYSVSRLAVDGELLSLIVSLETCSN